ncbi:M16 family metallopeptidase [Jannaschia seohaensis]|uniref:Zinc protease n=1 Tax=Jannaschia seohaensis TaxID=475081 RepID=A0A2Y9A496_9RHOB|nr:pitrilysin family protein [Jannaschia seohaensis]PWJ21990.1 zinc protease [Jannaschia seohaensis]SSA38268.1 zinc protease [Jannaschia seohaensis]
MTFLRALTVAAAAILPLPALAAVEIQEVTSEGGITAWLVEEPSIPFVAIELHFEGGANLDAPGKRGATNLMMALLEEGAGDRDARAFAEATEGLAASFGFEAFNDSVSVSAQVLTENRADALALLRDALVSPQFEQDDIDRVRDQVLAGIAQDETDPQEIASATMARLAFPDHPYGTQLEGTRETVSALTRDDLVAAHGAALTRDRVHVGVTGDITAEELGPLLDELLGALPESSAPEVPEAEYALAGGITVVDFPTPQSLVLWSHEGIMRDDEDFFPAYVMNHILGGSGFASKLMTEVREERGLTYGIGSFLVPRDLAAQYMGQFSSSNDKTAEAVQIVRDIWADVAANGIATDKLDAAKTYLTGAYPLRFDGNANIAGILVSMQAQHLPIEYIATRNDNIMAVTPEDIARVARRILQPENLHFVVVGQPDGLETGPLPAPASDG